MFVNDIEEYQAALSKINLRESTMPVYKGRIVESASAYNKARCILDCPEMCKAHKFCYNIDWDNLCEEDCQKIDQIYQLGCDRGFIQEPVADDNAVFATNKCCGCGCDVEQGVDYCPDCQQSLGIMQEKCGKVEENDLLGGKVHNAHKDVEETPVSEAEDEAATGDAEKPAEEAEMDAAEEKPAEEEKSAEDPAEEEGAKEEKPEDDKNAENGEEKADQPEGTEADKEEQEADEKKDDAEKEEDSDGEDSKGMSAEEKNNLKDQYTKLFKSVMLKNKFGDAFCDLSLQDKAKVYAELAEKLGDSKPSDFLTKAEEKKLEGTVITA